MNELEQLKKEIAELKAWKRSLEMSHTIPLNIDRAFYDRLIRNIGVVVTSAKSSTSENQAVDEAGSASYSVLKPPDAFIQATVSGTIYYIPVFT